MFTNVQAGLINMDSWYRAVVLETWEDIHQYGNSDCIFRGHASADWELQSSFERCCDREDISPANRFKFENRLVREFQRAYHHYDNRAPELTNLIEWLSIMQHYGAPTRLVDFTYSMYVAAFFAVEAATGDSAVWAVDKRWVLKEAMEALVRQGHSIDDCLYYSKEPFGVDRERLVTQFFFAPESSAMMCPVNPFHLNQRLRIQKGVFLIPGDVSRSFIENMMAIGPTCGNAKVIKMVIPKDMRRIALRNLHQMNISNSSLFPGLDGFARSLSTHLPLIEPNGWGSDEIETHLRQISTDRI